MGVVVNAVKDIDIGLHTVARGDMANGVRLGREVDDLKRVMRGNLEKGSKACSVVSECREVG